MTINADVQSTSRQTPENIKEKVEGAAGEVKEKVEGATGEVKEKVEGAAGDIKERARGAARQLAGRVRGFERFAPSGKHVLRSSLTASAVSIASILIASAMRRENPLESFGMMGERLRFVPSRKRYEVRHVLSGLGSVIGGSIILAAITGAIGRRTGDRPFMRGAMTALTAIGVDSAIFRRGYMRNIVKSLGLGGTALKYGGLGAACALEARRREHGEQDYASTGYGYEGEASAPPVWSDAEVGSVGGVMPESPQPIV